MTRRLTTLFAHIDARHADAVERLREYLRQPSISATGEGLQATAERLGGHLRALGFAVELVPTAGGGPVVIGDREIDLAKPTVLLYGHYDVQPPDPLEAWTSAPFAADLRDGRVYARGASDNKGQHFAHLLAIEALLDVEGALPVNLRIVLDGEEEVGSPGLAGVVRERIRSLASDVVIAADGTIGEDGTPLVYLGCRGYLSFELRAIGADRDLHSGHWADIAPNPAWKLVQLLATMRAPDGRITIDGLAPPADAPLRPSLTINGLASGYAGQGSKAIVPARAVAKCDLRLVPGQRAAVALERVREHVETVAPDIEVAPLGGLVDPAVTSPGSRWLPAVLAGVRDGQGRAARVIPVGRATLPHHVWAETLGADTMIIPYANADARTHAPDENLDLARFSAGLKTSAALLVQLGEVDR